MHQRPELALGFDLSWSDPAYLATLVPDGPDGALLQAWGNNIRHGTVPAADANYQTVREMIEDIQIPMKGNF